MRIRPATPADARALSLLARRVFIDTYGDMIPPAAMGPYLDANFDPGILADDLARARCRLWVAEVAGAPAGVAMLSEGGHPGVIGLRPLELRRLYVDRARQNSGLGSALLKAAEADAIARGDDVMWLQVWRENTRAMTFYLRHGFVVAGAAPVIAAGVHFEDDLMVKSL